MLMCFIDESSLPPKPGQRGRPPFFAIGAVFIPMAQWHDVARELQSLKEQPRFNIRGEIKWRYFGTENSDPKNTVRHLDPGARDAFRKRFFNIITLRNSIKLVAAVAHVQNAYKQSYVNDEHDLYGYTYKPVSERFQYHLQDLSRSTGNTHLGIIVSDHRDRKDDHRMRQEHQKLVHSKSQNISSYDNVIESIFLTPSHNSVGIQFADMVAGAVSRKFNSNDSRWFDYIKPAFRKRPDGSVDGYGLVKFPSNW